MNMINVKELIAEFEWVKSQVGECSKDEVEEVIQRIKKFPIVDAVSRELFEQYKWERDVAIAQLEELGLSLGQKIEYANVIPREQYEDLRDAFVDFACSGTSNLAPYCKNCCDECVDIRGWCVYKKCRGFNPDGRKHE